MGENDAKIYYPDIRQAVWLLIRVVLWMILLSIPLGVVDYFVDYPLYKHPAVLAIMNLAAFGLVLKWGIGKTGRTLEEICPTSSVVASLYPVMALLCMGANILLSETDNILRIVLPAPEWVMQSLVELVGGKHSLWGSVLILVIVAPITEEFLFRGLILDGFLRKYSVRKAILVSALLFAAFHLNPWQFVAAFVVGILFAWWRVNTGSILPGILG
ncbi:MAG: type II CAAX endopeptidase family protein, partial [Candidatus Poribacteria bacterium]|nr:type II CAAX endopeptidase family protein [Candidatus Poribacteria bacterium]